jgi:hypothetical protein
VIELVHGEAGGETRESFGELDTVLVYGLDFDLFGAPDRAVEPGDREAALESGAIFGTAKSLIFAYVQNEWI